ncbi:CBL-interacting serine/threonine-protein kinase 2 [Raphanus sativus]|uniref:non-specific serine/threonine protein kinase n=1 Tax=Raphanus sativus TaxID=3726 RepID=A0A6J0KGW0_RAPSA|nr:CBL-interacting serine/threonine-protein kinase 2 [Raphanus sativus]KAJ4883260.1 CBL-interacting serine/threonine-protein kinase 2 [Raphanus sativus]
MENKPSVLTDRYEVGRLLGQGTFAKVYYARSVHTNESVAIKMIDKDKVLRVGLSDQIKREISVMRIAKHPNVVSLREVMATKSRIYFVIEYCKGGELFNRVSKGKLREDVAWKYFHQLIDAVDFCHSRGVYHRDIKPENLLLDDNENLKVSDFGLSALADCKRGDGLLHTTCGTPAYVAPEVISRKGYDGCKADVWSCGVVLFVLLAGYLPFHDSNLMEMYRKIGRGDFKCPGWFAPEAKRLVCKMLDPNHETRITVSRIRESSWFRKGLHLKQRKMEKQQLREAAVHVPIPMEVGESSGSSENGESRRREEPPAQLAYLNAFDIISLSAGFDLGGLFGDAAGNDKRESRFASRKPAGEIICKLEEVARGLNLKIRKQDAGLFKLEGSKEGRKGALSMDAEIFQVTQTFHLVEVKKCDGDTVEYQRLVEEDLRPALGDVVWVWQGDKEKEEQQLKRGLQDQQEVEQQNLEPL